MKGADAAAAKADVKGLVKINVICSAIVAITCGIVVFACAYVAQGAMKALVESMPEWLTHGFEVAGGILPAVGFGMLLKVMLKAEFVPYLLIGFVIASFLQFSNLLPIALVGAALGILAYNADKDKARIMKLMKASGSEEDEEDGI